MGSFADVEGSVDGIRDLTGCVENSRVGVAATVDEGPLSVALVENAPRVDASAKDERGFPRC